MSETELSSLGRILAAAEDRARASQTEFQPQYLLANNCWTYNLTVKVGGMNGVSGEMHLAVKKCFRISTDTFL